MILFFEMIELYRHRRLQEFTSKQFTFKVMQSHPSWQSKLGPCVVPWGHGLTIIYCSYTISPFICSDPVFFQKHIYLMLWRYRKKISIWCALAAESLLMDYYSLFNNGMLFPWIVWFIGDSLLKNFFKRRCLNIWWVFCILSGFTAPVLS